jgi:hypothetical protein
MINIPTIEEHFQPKNSDLLLESVASAIKGTRNYNKAQVKEIIKKIVNKIKNAKESLKEWFKKAILKIKEMFKKAKKYTKDKKDKFLKSIKLKKEEIKLRKQQREAEIEGLENQLKFWKNYEPDSMKITKKENMGNWKNVEVTSSLDKFTKKMKISTLEDKIKKLKRERLNIFKNI